MLFLICSSLVTVDNYSQFYVQLSNQCILWWTQDISKENRNEENNGYLFWNVFEIGVLY